MIYFDDLTALDKEVKYRFTVIIFGAKNYKSSLQKKAIQWAAPDLKKSNPKRLLK